jgi:hypothetical protein
MRRDAETGNFPVEGEVMPGMRQAFWKGEGNGMRSRGVRAGEQAALERCMANECGAGRSWGQRPGEGHGPSPGRGSTGKALLLGERPCLGSSIPAAELPDGVVADGVWAGTRQRPGH